MKYLYTLISRISALIVIYTTSRIFFYLNNQTSLNNVGIFDFVEGIRFDISALFYINIPLIILLLFPNNLRTKSYYKRLTNILFYIVNIPFITLNNIDIEYFKFTQKRSTIDFFALLSLGEDTKNILPQYIKDYWPITVFTIIQLYFLQKLKNIPSEKIILNFKSINKHIVIFIVGISLFVVSARGGLQLKPIKPINAGELSNSENTALILNTPFCLIHTLGKESLEPIVYFNKNNANLIYPVIHKKNNKKLIASNIVILIMESYSQEFVGSYDNKISFTPFLDSLAKYSLIFKKSYANGLKSIEALPAITASIPTLMDNPFITSDLARNKFKSLASILKEIGYETSFFHGGIRGTMGFYSYCKRAGYDEYHGMEEYNNKLDYDGTWGIFDGPFMNYFANNLKEKNEPFFTTFFSLSSHPPYILPETYSENSNIDIFETIKYSDNSMMKFFNQIKEYDWYKNTIFIITADHTSPVQKNIKYKNSIGRYAIPLIVFKGDSSLVGTNNTIVQQIDIMPTVLDLINYNKAYFSFGKSVFSEESWAIHNISGKYRLITENGILINKQEKYLMYKDHNLTEEADIDSSDIKLLQAIKQTYSSRMLYNNLIYEN